MHALQLRAAAAWQLQASSRRVLQQGCMSLMLPPALQLCIAGTLLSACQIACRPSTLRSLALPLLPAAPCQLCLMRCQQACQQMLPPRRRRRCCRQGSMCSVPARCQPGLKRRWWMCGRRPRWRPLRRPPWRSWAASTSMRRQGRSCRSEWEGGLLSLVGCRLGFVSCPCCTAELPGLLRWPASACPAAECHMC